ncbi:hypothetical protein QOT17_013005 [Balamuthia mandrillaris]
MDCTPPASANKRMNACGKQARWAIFSDDLHTAWIYHTGSHGERFALCHDVLPVPAFLKEILLTGWTGNRCRRPDHCILCKAPVGSRCDVWLACCHPKRAAAICGQDPGHHRTAAIITGSVGRVRVAVIAGIADPTNASSDDSRRRKDHKI